MSASKAKNNFGYLIEEVYAKGKSIVITKNDRPVAKVSPIYNYKRTHTTSALTLNDSEYKKVKKHSRKLRKTSKFSF